MPACLIHDDLSTMVRDMLTWLGMILRLGEGAGGRQSPRGTPFAAQSGDRVATRGRLVVTQWQASERGVLLMLRLLNASTAGHRCRNARAM